MSGITVLSGNRAKEGKRTPMTRARSVCVRLALASVSTIALTAAARAQSPVYNWTGFYVGANAGGTWGRASTQHAINCNVPFFTAAVCSSSPANTALGNAVAANMGGAFTGSGLTFGGQLGYNWQVGLAVFGLEADGGYFNFNASRTVSGPATYRGDPTKTYVATSSVDSDFLFTFRGRSGATFGNLLAYATGGLAVTRLNVGHTFSDNTIIPNSGTWGSSSTRVGWTIGGGLEYALGNNWSVKAEYLYLNFGKVTSTGAITGSVPPIGYSNAISTTTDVTAHTARAGINFKF